MLVVHRIVNCSSSLAVHKLTTGAHLRDLSLPGILKWCDNSVDLFCSGIGQIAGIDGNIKREEFFYKFVSFTTAGDIYRATVDEPSQLV
jgi:hypothetical protein